LLPVIFEGQLHFLGLCRSSRLLSCSLFLDLFLSLTLNNGLGGVCPTSDSGSGILIDYRILDIVAPIAFASATLLRGRLAAYKARGLTIKSAATVRSLMSMSLGVDRTASATITSATRTRSTIITLTNITTRSTLLLGRLGTLGLRLTKLGFLSRRQGSGAGTSFLFSCRSLLFWSIFLNLRRAGNSSGLRSVVGKEGVEVLGRVSSEFSGGHFQR